MIYRVITLTGREFEATSLDQAKAIHDMLLGTGETAFLIHPDTTKSA